MSYLDRIDGDLLGMRGLTGTHGGLFVLLIIPVAVVVSLVSAHVDEQRLDGALDVAVNPLSVMLALGGLFLIAKLAGLNIAGGDGADEAITNRIATLVTGASGITLFAIIVHRLLPEGDGSRMLGAFILILVLFCFAVLVAGRRVIGHCEKLNSAQRVKSRTLPFLQKSAWFVDVVAWVSHILLAALIWYLAMRASGAQTVASTYFWVLVTGTAMFHATQICLLGFRGLTLGHLLAGVRVVDSRTGEPMGWKQAAVRTSVPVACFYIFLLFELDYPLGMDADVDGVKYLALITASATVIAVLLASFMSYWLLREIHAHGQGLLDLMSRTVTVALKGEPAATIPQSTTLSSEPEGAGSR